MTGHGLCDCKCRKPHSNFFELCIRVVLGIGLTSGTVGSRSSSYSIRNILGLLSLSSAILWVGLVLRPALSQEEAQAAPGLPPLRPGQPRQSLLPAGPSKVPDLILIGPGWVMCPSLSPSPWRMGSYMWNGLDRGHSPTQTTWTKHGRNVSPRKIEVLL